MSGKSYRLTAEQVSDIKAYVAAHRWSGAQKAIAKRYGIRPECVSRIVLGKTHKTGVDGRLKS